MQITSNAFAEGAPIPARYTCEGPNVSPDLRWSDIPQTAKSLALLVDDPDAPGGDWVHWVLYDVPGSVRGLKEDMPKSQYIPSGGKQGVNDFGHLGYGGPCPPPGRAHRYFFKLFALDRVLELRPGATRVELEGAMANCILDRGQMIGTFKR
jgi:Raf kinase inhibitor-like YbhB/YbcL family protein